MKRRSIKGIESLTEQEVKALEELMSRLKDIFNVKEVILFGSKARGDNNENSDVDVMVVIEGEELKENRDILLNLSFEMNYKYDTNIYAGLSYSDKWENPEYLALPLPANISREGVLLDV